MAKIKVIPKNKVSCHFPGQAERLLPLEGVVVEDSSYWRHCQQRGKCSIVFDLSKVDKKEDAKPQDPKPQDPKPADDKNKNRR